MTRLARVLVLAAARCRAQALDIDPAKVVDLTYGFGRRDRLLADRQTLRARGGVQRRDRAATGTRPTTCAPPSTAARTWTRRRISRAAAPPPIRCRSPPASGRWCASTSAPRRRSDVDYRLSVADLRAWEARTAAFRAARSSPCTAAGERAGRTPSAISAPTCRAIPPTCTSPASRRRRPSFSSANATSTPSPSTRRASTTAHRRISSSTRSSTAPTSRRSRTSPTSTAFRRAAPRSSPCR